ncbi:CopG family transcriptional regulator [bacterium]|nr:MAG: CopG family transcriptional regulator [bacterium]
MTRRSSQRSGAPSRGRYTAAARTAARTRMGSGFSVRPARVRSTLIVFDCTLGEGKRGNRLVQDEPDLGIDRKDFITHNHIMNRTSIVADGALLAQLRSLARRRGVSTSEIMRCALSEYVARAEPKGARPSFVGAGASGGRERLSERAEELLFEKRKRSR